MNGPTSVEVGVGGGHKNRLKYRIFLRYSFLFYAANLHFLNKAKSLNENILSQANIHTLRILNQ
jgi:hypothetical protein